MKGTRRRGNESCLTVLALLWCLVAGGPLDCLGASQAKSPAISKAPPRLSDAQTVALASEIVRYVTANPHNSKDWQWVQADLPEQELPQLSAIVRRELAKRYTVVGKESEPPAGARSTTRTYHFVNGFLLSIKVRRTRQDRVSVSYRDYESPVAGSAQTLEYEWAVTKWKIVSESDMIIY